MDWVSWFLVKDWLVGVLTFWNWDCGISEFWGNLFYVLMGLIELEMSDFGYGEFLFFFTLFYEFWDSLVGFQCKTNSVTTVM